jgi:hypothetical protein
MLIDYCSLLWAGDRKLSSKAQNKLNQWAENDPEVSRSLMNLLSDLGLIDDQNQPKPPTD